MNEIPSNTHSYRVTVLETEVATIGLLSFWIQFLLFNKDAIILDVVDENYIINVIKLFMKATLFWRRTILLRTRTRTYISISNQ